MTLEWVHVSLIYLYQQEKLLVHRQEVQTDIEIGFIWADND